MQLISMRIAKDDLQKIDHLARNLRVSRAKVIRALIEGHLDKMKPIQLSSKERNSFLHHWQEAVVKLGELCTDINQVCRLNQRLGNNINQIAKNHNTGTYISPTTQRTAMQIIQTLINQNNALKQKLTQMWQFIGRCSLSQ